MLTDQQRRLNQLVWEQKSHTIMNYFQKYYPKKNLMDILSEGVALDNTGWSYLSDSFALLMTGHVKESQQTLLDAKIIAEAALKSERFAPIFAREIRSEQNATAFFSDPTIPPDIIRQITEEEFHIEQLNGHMIATRTLAYADWFLSGVRSADSFRQVADLHGEFFALWLHKFGENSVIDLLQDYVGAELYSKAIHICQERKVIKPASNIEGYNSLMKDDCELVALPTSTVQYALCLTAHFALGDKQAKIEAESQINYCYQHCLNWDTGSAISWNSRLEWAYIRAREFGGYKDLETLLHELHGY